jgi:hypothetical protein
LIWNVRTVHADALLGPARDVSAPRKIRRLRPQHAGHQIDQRGLAGAVGPDQCVALALRQVELDVLGDDQRAEALVELARG